MLEKRDNKITFETPRFTVLCQAQLVQSSVSIPPSPAMLPPNTSQFPRQKTIHDTVVSLPMLSPTLLFDIKKLSFSNTATNSSPVSQKCAKATRKLTWYSGSTVSHLISWEICLWEDHSTHWKLDRYILG